MINELIAKSEMKIENGKPISLPLGIASISRGIEILNLLYDQEVEDNRATPYSRDLPHKDHDKFEKLRLRVLARASSYIITACNIDGNFKRSYGFFLRALSESGITIPTQNVQNGIVSSQKSKLKNLFFYRNKVIAHTSFSDPRRDSVELQMNSDLYYSGQIMHLEQHYMGLGTGGFIVESPEEEALGFSLVEDHADVVTSFDDWANIFLEYYRIHGKERMDKALKDFVYLS